MTLERGGRIVDLAKRRIFTMALERHDRHVPFFMGAVKPPERVEIRPLEFSRVLDLRRYTEVTEMHDRLIVAEAAAQGASLITSDEEITTANLVPCVW